MKKNWRRFAKEQVNINSSSLRIHKLWQFRIYIIGLDVKILIGGAPWYQGFCRPESVRSGAHKVPVHRPGYRHHDRGVSGGIDLGDCLEQGDHQPTEKTCICTPGVTPGPVRAVSIRLARTQDDDSRDHHYIYEQEKKYGKVQQEIESADQDQADRKAPTQ